MKKTSSSLFSIQPLGMAFLLALALPACSLAQTGWLQTGAGPYNYTNTANWVGGTVNGLWDSSLTLTAAQTATFDADAVIPSLTFNYAGDYNVTLRSDGTANRTLTLGGDIAVAPAKSRTITIGSTSANNGLDIDLGGTTRNFSATSGRNLVIANAVANGGVSITGVGAVALNGANTFTGGVTLKEGKVKLGNASALGAGTFNIGDTVGTTPVSLESTVGSLVNSQNNPQNWNQDFTFSNSQSLNLGTGTVTLAGSRAIDVAGYTLTVGGAIGSGPYSITKNGTGNLFLNGANTYGGGTIINAGDLQFGPGAVPATGTILVNAAGTLNAGSAFPTIQGLLDSGKIDKTSTGTLALTGNSSESIDFNTSGYSNLLLGASTDSTFTGTLTPYNGVYRLGGGGKTLTFANANTLTGPNRLVVGAPGSSAGTPTITASQNFTGSTTIESQTLEISGANGAFTASPITVNQGATLNFNSPAGVGGATRAPRVTLKTGAISVTGNSTANSVENIGGPIVFDIASTGGADFIKISPTASMNAQLTASAFVRTNAQIAVLSGTNLGSAPAANVGNILLTTPPAPLVGGGGSAGTSNISIIPWAIGSIVATDPSVNAALSFVTYDGANGFRPLNVATEYDVYANGYSGAVTGTDRNVRLPANATVTFTGDNIVNSLYMGTSANGATLNGTGKLTVTSGAIFMAANSASTIAVPIDFGTAQGVIGVWQGKGTVINASIAGSGGLVLYQPTLLPTTYSSGASVSIKSPGTYTGDTYILGKVTLDVVDILPCGSRTGDIYLYGIIEANNGTFNGLNGTGRITRPSSGSGTISLGDNDANGDFVGQMTQNGALSLTKIGTGTQRLGGPSTWTGAATVSGGTLIADGSFISAFTVQTNAILRGKGLIDKSGTAITVKNGGKIAPGDANGIGTMTVLQGGVVFEDGAVMEVTVGKTGQSALSVAGHVTGGFTIPVTVNGDGVGKWKILEADAIAPDFESATSGVVLTLEADGTELWAERLNPATVLIVR